MLEQPLLDFGYLAPEMIVCGTILFVLLGDLFFGMTGRKSGQIALIGALLAFLMTLESCFDPRLFDKITISGGVLQVDLFSQYTKLVFLLTAILSIIFTSRSVDVAMGRRAEFFSFLLGATSGMMFLVSSMDLAVLYLSFEMVSLCSYILAGFIKGDPRSAEAGYKYVVYGAVSSGIMVFGLTYLYGMTGTTNLNEMGFMMSRGLFTYHFHMLVPVLMVVYGFGYKIAAFPFHFWAPDVYEGSPLPVTAFFSVGTKAAGFAIFLRFVLNGLSAGQGPADLQWLTTFLVIVAGLTMTLGNLAALNQSNIKRMLAYSAIAHAGYMLMGVAMLNVHGSRAVLFYLFAYVFMNLGAFVVVIALFNLFQTEQIEELGGMGRLYPLAGVCMAVFLFSLTGLPPTMGFIGKFYIFAAVVEEGFIGLAVVGVLNSVVSLFYYMRIMKAFFFSEASYPQAETEPGWAMPNSYQALMLFCAVPLLVVGVYWAPLIRFAGDAVGALILR